MTDQHYDVVVLGGGSGGYSTALRCEQLGLSVALIERDKLGGTCLHEGCIPTKALLHAAEVADTARGASSVGIRASYDGVDMAGVHGYRKKVVSRLFKGLVGLVASRSITVVQGHGRLKSASEVDVDGNIYTGTRAVVIATGSTPRTIPGIAISGRIVTSAEALELTDVPASVIVLGGGVIGVEFASIWRSLGAQVTIMEGLSRLLPGEDEASSAALQRALRKRGITVRTGVRVTSARQDATGVQVIVNGAEEVSADVLLVAVGRGPRSQELGLEELGIELEDGFLSVDERLRTNVDGVYAVGDVVGGPQLAHRSFQQGIFLAESLAGLNPAPIDDVLIPRVTYSDPEVASVGLTQRQAEHQLGEDQVECVQLDLAANGKSQILGTAGFVKVVRQREGPVLGVHLVGSRVGELIGEAQLSVAWEAYPDDVAAHIHAHPTQGEAVGEAFLALAGKALHAHG